MNNTSQAYTEAKEEMDMMRKIVEEGLHPYPIAFPIQYNRFELIQILQESYDNPKFNSAVKKFVTDELSEIGIVNKLSSIFEKFYIDVDVLSMPTRAKLIYRSPYGHIVEIASMPVVNYKIYQIQPIRILGNGQGFLEMLENSYEINPNFVHPECMDLKDLFDPEWNIVKYLSDMSEYKTGMTIQFIIDYATNLSDGFKKASIKYENMKFNSSQIYIKDNSPYMRSVYFNTLMEANFTDPEKTRSSNILLDPPSTTWYIHNLKDLLYRNRIMVTHNTIEREFLNRLHKELLQYCSENPCNGRYYDE